MTEQPIPASQAPHRSAPSMRAARWVRRAMLPVAVLLLLLLWWNYGVIRVPEGMDTTPSVPPGSVCIIDKGRSAATPGKLVFVDLPAGGTLLSRLAARGDGTVTVQNDNPSSVLPDSRQLGPLPLATLRGTVVTSFVPDAPPELPSGR